MEFREIRRQDRLLEPEGIQRLLNEGEYGFLAMCTPEGYGYGIPLSFARDGDKIYFHCAPEGYKLEALKGNNKVSFCIVGPTEVIPGKFSTAYESAHVFGRIHVITEREEKLKALDLIVDKYSADFKDISHRYITASFNRTCVLRLDIEHRSGKTKRMHP